MISKHRAQIALMVIFIIMLFSTIKIVEAQYESQTIRISDTDHDGFVTESGIMWSEATLIHILDPNMEIRAFLMFENIEINSYEVLNNATLRVRPGSQGPVDPGSNIFIYGVKAQNFLGFPSAADVTSAPRTFAFVNLDTSVFPDGAWTEIDVTDIISELIANPAWDGDDIGGISDNIGFVFSGPDAGYDTRYFYDESAGNNLEAQLIINWGDAPPPPTPPAGDPPLPPGDPDPEVNETYREFIIWEVDNNGPNRTGEGFTLNWNDLNMTELTELDGGNDLTLNNDTWLTITSQLASADNSMYNDSGAPANITSFFARFAINVSAVTNNLGGGQPDRVFDFASVSTASPVGGGGLLDGLAGDQAGVFMYLHADDARWRFRLIERSGAAFAFGPAGLLITEGDGNIYYGEFVFVDDGIQSYIRYQVFTDPLFQNEIDTDTLVLTQASGPMRYPKVASTLSAGPSVLSAQFYTFLDFQLPENSTWMVTFPNGTIIVSGLDDYDDAILFIEDLLGADPQEPDPPGQGWDPEGPFARFRTRLYILIIGIVLVFGPFIYWAMSRPSGYEFVIGAFIIFIGFALMYAAGQV